MSGKVLFEGAKFMTAEDKAKVHRQWCRFLESGDWDKFTVRLYQHLTLGCSFTAHYDKHGFMAHYIGPGRTIWLLVR